ncbi:uncharacterized protein LOC129984322 isoform X3 [Argiope bruennichi]|uniref:uncharacterized protein LOC129984322 isoform X3 n=1 Tax=Argiope bruennichi TaxID=94029 RepID=UPI0024946ABF|nr:uncharacterized protein LOC129984322 isoform X3 [Argiope bruennichi]
MYIQMIDVKLLFILWNLSIIVIASYDAVETTDEKLSTSSLKNDILSNPQETPNIQNDNEGTTVERFPCIDVAVAWFECSDFWTFCRGRNLSKRNVPSETLSSHA